MPRVSVYVTVTPREVRVLARLRTLFPGLEFTFAKLRGQRIRRGVVTVEVGQERAAFDVAGFAPTFHGREMVDHEQACARWLPPR